LDLVKVFKKDFESIQNYKNALSNIGQKTFIIKTEKKLNDNEEETKALEKVAGSVINVNDDNVTVSKFFNDNNSEIVSTINHELKIKSKTMNNMDRNYLLNSNRESILISNEKVEEINDNSLGNLVNAELDPDSNSTKNLHKTLINQKNPCNNINRSEINSDPVIKNLDE